MARGKSPLIRKGKTNMATTYDFVTLSGNAITINQVKQIILAAKANPKYVISNYTYANRVDGDGVLVTANAGAPVMTVTLLRAAAKALGFPEQKLEIVSPNDEGSLVADAGTPYQVTISMTAQTVSQLLAAGFFLYGFKAVQTSMAGGSPVVWFATQEFSATTTVNWQEQYQAYTSNSQIIPGGGITASFAASITLGQTLNVEAGGVGDVTSGGPSTAISILNTVSTPFTCGISELQGANYNALCAFPLFGNNEDVIAPIERVFLMFSTQPVNTGTVIEQSYGPGILIDLTASNQRTVNYDINTGWSWGGGSWAQMFPPNSDMVPMLIETSDAAPGKVSLVQGAA
jgi:hypothetical protein